MVTTTRGKTLVFTDLDGTLLDARTYSFEAAVPALDALRARDVPLIFCSSKTQAEILPYRSQLGNQEPFVSENGGGIFFPKSGGRMTRWTLPTGLEAQGDFWLLRLGAEYGALRELMHLLRGAGYPVRGFGDMTAEEVSARTGLGVEQAQLAKRRDFDEPFVLEGGAEGIASLVRFVRERGFNVTRGRFFHLLGASDKGTAVAILKRAYGAVLGEVQSVALGDSPNDLPMLAAVDLPMVVQQPDGTYPPGMTLPGLRRIPGVGPVGWNLAMLELVERIGGS